ncbi:MAG: coproporphyrinogen III oxidase, partial [Lachnospiraceae bacterium]|nr:coproporphyrinogen III oxidase [Lachnospiraceae bacterium]
MKSNDISVYVHFPFCVRKCLYCDFNSAPASRETMRAYTHALLTEITAKRNLLRGRKLSSVYLGGGTPSLMDPGDIAAVLSAIDSITMIGHDTEVSMEVNPGTLGGEYSKGAGGDRVAAL